MPLVQTESKELINQSGTFRMIQPHTCYHYYIYAPQCTQEVSTRLLLMRSGYLTRNYPVLRGVSLLPEKCCLRRVERGVFDVRGRKRTAEGGKKRRDRRDRIPLIIQGTQKIRIPGAEKSGRRNGRHSRIGRLFIIV